MSATKVKAIIVLLVIFALGVITGWAGGTFKVQYRMKQMMAKGSPPLKEFFMQRISHNLDLTDAQRAKIEPIIQETELELHRFLNDARVEFVAIMAGMTTQMKEHLTPAQREEVDKNFGRFQERCHISPEPKK
jgi:Spy/CpxP family protein refolding chaperone